MPSMIHLPDGNPEETSVVFSLLASIWAKEVESKTLKQMLKPPFSTAWKLAGEKLPSTVSAELIEELSVDYCQLLIGPKNSVSPFQSEWDQDRFQGDATASMQKYVEMLKGFSPCIDIVDHVAVQLQFIGALIGMTGQTKRTLIQGLGKAFCRDHLEWTEPFFSRVERQAKTGFYQSTAKISRQFLFG